MTSLLGLTDKRMGDCFGYRSSPTNENGKKMPRYAPWVLSKLFLPVNRNAQKKRELVCKRVGLISFLLKNQN